MIAGILITALVLALLGVWFLVLVIEYMSAVKQACKVYVSEVYASRVRETPPVPEVSPAPTIEQQLLRLKGHRKP